jgi:transcriptional regulator with XRE-family HTH domain
MSARTGQSVRQRRAAAELKRLRELSLMTAEEVARRLGWSPSKVSRVENARIRLKPDDVERLLALYGVTGERQATLISLVEDTGGRRWWDTYADILSRDYLTFIGFEAEAASALNYEPMVIPGLLQTEAYARHVVHMWGPISAIPPSLLERRLEVRMRRQRVIYSDVPLRLSVIIDEAVLRRQVGEPPVMREQLHHLVETSELPNVELQVDPLSGSRPTMPGPMVSLRVPEFGEVLYLEDLTGGRLYLDQASVIYEHGLVFERLAQAALSPAESRALIEKTADELW